MFKLKLVMVFLFFYCSILGENAVEKKVLRYSTNPQYPPYDWALDGNNFSGAGVELLEKVTPKNVILKPEVYPWKRSFLLAKEGEIDLLMPIRITPERSEYLQFLKHRAFPNPIVVFVKINNNIIFKKFEDLKPYVGGVSMGDTFGGGFDEYYKKELKIEEAGTMVENFKKLELGRIDYFVSGYYAGMTYLRTNRLDNKIKALEQPISDNDIHFGFSKKYKDTEVMDYIDNKLEEMDKNGELERLLKKYIDIYSKNPVIFNP